MPAPADESPTVSVIIPAFNAAAFIEEALASVAASEQVDAEIVVVDDGSSDGTPELVRAWSSKHARPVLVIHQENSGISVARNVGILESRGEFLAFLDADDCFLPQHLYRLLQALKSQPDAILACDDVELFGEEVPTAPSLLIRAAVAHPSLSLGTPPRIPGTLEHLEAFDLIVAGNPFAPSSWMLSRSAFGRTGLFDPLQRICEDREFLLRASRAGPFAIVAEVGVRKRIHAANLTHPRNAPQFDRHALGVLCRARARASDQEERLIGPAVAEQARELSYHASTIGFAEWWRLLGWLRDVGANNQWSIRDLIRSLWVSLLHVRRALVA